MSEELARKLDRAANRLTKWRSVFAGWQLGTRPKGDPECDAVRDHREVTMLLRAEVNALTKLLLEAQVCTVDELQRAMIEECNLLSKDYEGKFPGMKATDEGIDYDVQVAAKTMKNWRP